MDVPTARSMARASWGDVQKTRASLHAQVTDVRKERGNATYMAMFDGIEQKLSQLRLACMQVIFHDFEYAADKKAEHTLWQAHTSVNSEYRRVVGRLCGQSQVVQKRKLERMYKDFLKTSQSFYCGYIQRLASRFFIPELCQAAQRLNVQPTDMPSRDASVPDPVRKLVTSSCQRSLVHLGDLSRYRCQISDKSTKTSFDTALAYYGLANSVDPDNGSAHHQMAVLYQLHAQHFEIVYHFHRAIAIAKPHELGLGNLEREYRGLQHPTPAAQAGAPADAMVSWFVRLHGFYFHGEPFSQQAELETEVLHRSEQAYKAQNPNHVLLRMALINIAAYEIATSKVKESWTLTASRTCQFLLRWTIRSIALLLRLVKAEFLDSRATLPTSVISTGSDESPMSSSALFTSHLALLRMYIAWIYTVRSDIVEYRAFLEPHASDVYRLLADSLTLFNEYVDQFSDTLKSAYLLPEDVEAIGLRPLEDRRLPLFFHVLEESDTRTYKKFKVRKQRKEELGANHSVQTETVWRIRDIVYCGILLAGSTHFPVSITAIQRPDGRTTEGWVFTDENPAASYITEIEMSRMLRRLELPNSKIIHDQQGTRPVQTQSATRALTPTNAVSPGTLLSDKQIAAHPTNDATHSERISAQPNANKATSAVGDSELNQDSEMLDMVNKLLDPADDGSSKHSSAFHESSYGMNTSTANDIFGHIGHSSDQPSPVAKQIPNLPWEYFYNASWNEPSTQARGQAIIDRSYVPRSSVGSRDDMRESLGGVTGQVPGVGVRNDRRSAFDKVGEGAASPRQSQSQNRGVERFSLQPQHESSRHAVLESLAQALYAQHGLPPGSPSAGLAPGLAQTVSGAAPPRRAIAADRSGQTGGWPAAPRYGSEGSSLQQMTPLKTYTPAPGSKAISISPNSNAHRSDYGLVSEGRGPYLDPGQGITQTPGPQSRHIGPLSTGSAQRPASAFGLANTGHPGSQVSQEWDHLGSMDPSVIFSHPSSLFGGTPDAVSANRAQIRAHSRGNILLSGIPASAESLELSRSLEIQRLSHQGSGDVGNCNI